MKHRIIRILFAGIFLLAMVLCMTGCRLKQQQEFPELHIDPETFSTGFQPEQRSTPAVFLRSGDHTAKAVFVPMLSATMERVQYGTYTIKNGILTVTFPDSGETMVFSIASAETLVLVKEKSNVSYLKNIPECTVFYNIGYIPMEDVME